MNKDVNLHFEIPGYQPSPEGPSGIMFGLLEDTLLFSSEETAGAAVNIGSMGIPAQVYRIGSALPQQKNGGETDPEKMLYVTDSPAEYGRLTKQGLAAAGYLHKGNAGAQFPGAKWLIQEPDCIDIDSYVKIYQRLKGIPWTIFDTPRCRVREMTAEDLDGLYRLYEDPAAVRYMKGFSDDREEEREKLLSYIEKVYGFYGYGYWAVVLKNSGDLIGRVGFGKPEGDGHDASVGYLIRKDKRHQGYGFEVTQAALEYAFHAIGMSAIDAVTDPENTASVSLLKKLGFSEETMQEGENHDQSALFVYARQ